MGGRYHIKNLYLSVPDMVASQLRQADKEQMKAICTALLTFGYEKGLLTENPLDWDGTLCRNVVIYERHLTQRGRLYFNDLTNRWLAYTDRTNKIDNVKMLEKWYSKMIENE